MSTLAIFIYGAVVSGLVGAAMYLIVWGIAQEKRDRAKLVAQGRAKANR